MSTRPALRVMQLNLWNHRGDLRERLELAADLLEQERPHVVTIQEAAALAGGTPAEHYLAQLTGLDAIVSSSDLGYRTRFRQGLLTALPVTGRHEQVLPGHSWSFPGCSTSVVSAHVTSTSGRSWHVGSTHLAWGGQAEPARCAQVRTVEEFFARHTRPGEVGVLGGDFNAVPSSDAVRFLTGQHALGEAGAYWMDAWDVAGDGGPGHTSTPVNENAVATAAAHLVDPTMAPGRRIDYVMVRGWAWGNPGMPLGTRVVAGAKSGPADRQRPPSDHFAVVADLWDPPLT